MNYLSHYYFDRVEDNKYYNIGLILPDLARSYISKLRINPRQNITFSTKEIGSINKGCNRHFESDRKFHNWKTFISLSEEATEIIRESGEKDIDKDFFYVHVFIEILLDKILIEKEPTLASEFYAMIESVEFEWVLKFMRYAGLQDDELFKGSHRRFMKARFLENYNTLEQCIDALEQAGTKIGLKEFSDVQKEVLLEVAHTIEPQLTRSIDALEIQLL